MSLVGKLTTLTLAVTLTLATLTTGTLTHAQTNPTSAHCGEKLLLLVRGSSEEPQGPQPNQLTYQQQSDDLFANSPTITTNPTNDLTTLTGGGLLARSLNTPGARTSLNGAKVATLVYPAHRIEYKGGILPTLDNFHTSASIGQQQLTRTLHTIYNPCPTNPPQLILAGYSQGADVINLTQAAAVQNNNTHNIDNVTKYILIADPSRRPQGPENTNAHIQMAATNTIGGISRAVTDSIGYQLVLPTLDNYRNNAGNRISSYCMPGDLVCDTRTTEGSRGTSLHTSYDVTTARCNATTYTNYMDCAWADATTTWNTPTHPNPHDVTTPADQQTPPATVHLQNGWVELSISRLLRNEHEAQTVTLHGYANGIEVLRSQRSIRGGGSGSVALYITQIAPIPNLDLTIELDGRTIAQLPATFTPTAPNKNATIYIQSENEDVTQAGPPLIAQIADWEIPLEQRMGLIYTMFGNEGVRWARWWISFIYEYDLDPDHNQQLQQFIDAQNLPGHDPAATVANPILDRIVNGLMDEHRRLRIYDIDLLTFLSIATAVV